MERKRYSRKFQRMAVARMETCENVGELARELGVRPRLCLARTKSACEMNNIQRGRVTYYMENIQRYAEFWRGTGATDGQPTSVVVLLALRESASGAEHVQVFSQLARRLMHEEFRKSVMGSASSDYLMRFLAAKLNPHSLKNPADRTGSHGQFALRRGI